jgi:hypothetical protein
MSKNGQKVTKTINFPILDVKMSKKTPKIPKKHKHGQISHGPASTFFVLDVANFGFWGI